MYRRYMEQQQSKITIDEKTNTFFNATIIIIENLADTFIIGQDVIGSDFVNSVTKNNVHFLGPDDTEIIVPLETKLFPKLQCKSLNACIIPPYTPYLIACATTNSNPLDKNTSFILQQGPIKNLTCLDMLYDATNTAFHVAVYNEDNSDMSIEESDILFDVEIIPHNTVQINRLSLIQPT